MRSWYTRVYATSCAGKHVSRVCRPVCVPGNRHRATDDKLCAKTDTWCINCETLIDIEVTLRRTTMDEIIRQGPLLKSREERRLNFIMKRFKSQYSRRYFVLRAHGGQYLLQYYPDQTMRGHNKVYNVEDCVRVGCVMCERHFFPHPLTPDFHSPIQVDSYLSDPLTTRPQANRLPYIFGLYFDTAETKQRKNNGETDIPGS